MTVSIFVLIYQLRKKSTFEFQKETFKCEKFFIIAILILFDLSFIIRYIMSKYIGQGITAIAEESSDGFQMPVIIMIVFGNLFFDILPISLILFIHSYNFKSIPFINSYRIEIINTDGNDN